MPGASFVAPSASRLLCLYPTQELEGLIQAIHSDDNKVSRVVSVPSDAQEQPFGPALAPSPLTCYHSSIQPLSHHLYYQRWGRDPDKGIEGREHVENMRP